MDPFSKNQTGVVTGAASGIGRAAARYLKQHEMRFAVVDLPGPKLDEIAAETGALKVPVDGFVAQIGV